jgi:O-antigen ligase
MGIDIAQPLRMKRGTGRPFPANHFVKPRRRGNVNALLGMGLWILLWLGYNTSYGYVLSPNFSTKPTYFIHGVRAFFPMLAAWLAFVIIFTRSKRVFSWIVGPLGLMLLYAVIGLISSAAFSPNPTDAMYYGANYLAIVMVLLAIVPVEDPLPDIRRVLNLTWYVGFLLTLSLLGLIPFLGSQAITETETNPVGVRAYAGEGQILGMASTRNTGFARYAAISALVALPRLMRKGNLVVRIIWGILFTASFAALVIANGRTETLAFVGSVAVILGIERTKRTVNFLIGTAGAILLGLRGFFSGFYLYITRTGEIDPTMTGRTTTWQEAWHFLWDSPWVGFGFQADRYYLGGQHMHNAFLHSFFQAGILGGGAIVIGLLIVWGYILKYFFFQQPADRSLIPPEIPAVFLFMTISSITESTFAYFSAAWLLSAPIVAYVMALHRQMRVILRKAAQDRALRVWLARRKARFLGPPLEAPPSTAG